MTFKTLVEQLRLRATLPLPGQAAQYKMAHAFRRNWNDTIPENAVASAVIALIFPIKNEPHVLFIQRSSRNSNDRHSGQISFPGGRFEHGSDADLLACALRETMEEVGVQLSQEQIIVQMTPLYIPVSNFMVTPFLAVLESEPTFVLQENEVAGTLLYPLSHFSDASNIKTKTLDVGNGLSLDDVRYYDLDGKILWGATAMMMSELMEMIN